MRPLHDRVRRPALAAERFVPDPFSSAAGARMYRTGYRGATSRTARWRSWGAWMDQLKVRGFRGEPGEVEAALHELPGISAAAVAVRGDAAGERSLVAYVVPAAGEAMDPGQRSHGGVSIPPRRAAHGADAWIDCDAQCAELFQNQRQAC